MQIYSIFYANLLPRYMNIFVCILPLIYCQIISVDFIIYLLTLSTSSDKSNSVKKLIKKVKFVFLPTKFVARF